MYDNPAVRPVAHPIRGVPPCVRLSCTMSVHTKRIYAASTTLEIQPFRYCTPYLFSAIGSFLYNCHF